MVQSPPGCPFYFVFGQLRLRFGACDELELSQGVAQEFSSGAGELVAVLDLAMGNLGIGARFAG